MRQAESEGKRQRRKAKKGNGEKGEERGPDRVSWT